MKPKVLVAVVLVTTGMVQGATLNVSVPTILVPGATVGTEFDVPISVSIPDGTSGQGLARLYVRVLSSDSTNAIAPVPGGTLVFTSWGVPVTGFGAKIGSFLRDLDGDGDLDAGDTGLTDLGNVLNNAIGIEGSSVVMTQRWKFLAAPTAGQSYALAVQFPATKSRHYDGAGKAVPFITQTGVNGSVQMGSYATADLAAVLAAMDTANTTLDKDGDGWITSSDLAIVLANLN